MASKLNVTLCGSFRRDPEGLKQILATLQQSYNVLSPKSVDFVNPDEEFVRLEAEQGQSVQSIELKHIQALKDSDFVWLFAPEGYVGRSAAMEIGVAHALGIPVFTDSKLEDEMLDSFVTRINNPEMIALGIEGEVRPGDGLEGLQKYYKRAAERRGWEDENAQDTLLLMLEEMGELARAIRKQKGLKRAGGYGESEVGLELADVQLYLIHLANGLEVNIANAVTQKEEINAERARTNAR